MKLFITDHADPNVGLFSSTWEIECPFENNVDDKEFHEWFRTAQIEIYKEIAVGKITAEYDFERKAWMELEERLLKFQ